MTMTMKNIEDAGVALIPLVLAFAAGVAVMGIARDMQSDDRIASAEVAAAEAADQADRYRRMAHYLSARARQCHDELAEMRAAAAGFRVHAGMGGRP